MKNSLLDWERQLLEKAAKRGKLYGEIKQTRDRIVAEARRMAHEQPVDYAPLIKLVSELEALEK